MEDTIINGVSIEALKAQRTAIRRDASAFIADNLAKVQVLVKEIIDADGVDVDGNAEKALELLQRVDIVADVSGVTYCLPYNEPYDGGNALSDGIDDIQAERNTDAIEALYDQLQEMENNSFLWNSSSIGC